MKTPEESFLGESSNSVRSQDVTTTGITNDEGLSWICSLCTYRNSYETFKCDVCEARRGTSTRKPRNSSDNLVAQVLRQQEQIRQQAIKSTRPHTTKSSNTPTKVTTTKSQTDNKVEPTSSSEDIEVSNDSDTSIASSSKSSSHASNNNINIDSSNHNNNNHTGHVSIKSGIKPRVAEGKTGLIIDKRRFTQHSITFNDVTITVTEYATRQKKDKQPRKKKKKKIRRPHQQSQPQPQQPKQELSSNI